MISIKIYRHVEEYTFFKYTIELIIENIYFINERLSFTFLLLYLSLKYTDMRMCYLNSAVDRKNVFPVIS
jgi:hypothetical protein